MRYPIDKEIIKAVWPIWLGYIPLGFAGGVLAQKVGLSVTETGVMSILVFAGSGQFIALAMMGGGSSIASVVMTTFIVNLRHLLYSSTLAQYLQGVSPKYLGVFAQGITDETFAMNLNKFTVSSSSWTPAQALRLNILAHACWIGSNMLGNIVGNTIYIDTAIVSYTLTAMFIGLWSYHFNNLLSVGIGIFSGILALWLSLFLDNKLHIVVATIIAATAGCLIEGKRRQNDE